MFAYSNNGLSFRRWDDPNTLAPGEIFFDHAPTDNELAANFQNFASAGLVAAVPGWLAAKLAAGCQVVSSSVSAISGTYSLSDKALVKVSSIALYIKINSSFPAQQLPFPHQDINGAVHLFPTSQSFLNYATALADYVALLEITAGKRMAGLQADDPVQPMTIA